MNAQCNALYGTASYRQAGLTTPKSSEGNSRHSAFLCRNAAPYTMCRDRISLTISMFTLPHTKAIPQPHVPQGWWHYKPFGESYLSSIPNNCTKSDRSTVSSGEVYPGFADNHGWENACRGCLRNSTDARSVLLNASLLYAFILSAKQPVGTVPQNRGDVPYARGCSTPTGFCSCRGTRLQKQHNAYCKKRKAIQKEIKTK